MLSIMLECPLHHRRHPCWPLLLLLLSVSLPACMTSSQGRKMQRDIVALQASFDELRSEKERLKETLDRAQEEMRKMEEANARATDLFQRNTADFGVQIDRLRIENAQLKGQLETVQHELSLLQRGSASPPPTMTAPTAPPTAAEPVKQLPADRKELYAYAYDAYAKKDYAEARRAFKEYVTRHPKDGQADNALYFWGESFFFEGMNTEAVQVLTKILTDYSKGSKVDDTLFLIGQIFEKLGKCSNAKAFYEELVDKHPKSKLVRATQAKLRALERCK